MRHSLATDPAYWQNYLDSFIFLSEENTGTLPAHIIETLQHQMQMTECGFPTCQVAAHAHWCHPLLAPHRGRGGSLHTPYQRGCSTDILTFIYFSSTMMIHIPSHCLRVCLSIPLEPVSWQVSSADRSATQIRQVPAETVLSLPISTPKSLDLASSPVKVDLLTCIGGRLW